MTKRGNQADKRIATLADFAPQVEEVELPSMRGRGVFVRLRKPDPAKLVAYSDNGDIPQPLSRLIAASMTAGGDSPLMTPENVGDWIAAVNVIVVASFVEPRVVLEEDGENVPVDNIPLNDRMWIASWALGAEYTAGEKNQQESPADVGTVPDGAGDEPATE
jgi:hypothetical protein